MVVQFEDEEQVANGVVAKSAKVLTAGMKGLVVGFW